MGSGIKNTVVGIFFVDYIMQGGGSQNRKFTKIHFNGYQTEEFFLSDHPVCPGKKNFPFSRLFAQHEETAEFPF